MSTTINRSHWINDSGSPSAPVGDGTTINEAELQEIYANIDDLIAGSLAIGGVLTVEGFGVITFSAGGTGTHSVLIKNTTSGATNMGQLVVQGNSTNSTFLRHHSSTFTTSGPAVANGGRLVSDGSGGLTVEATAGDLRLYAASVRKVTIPNNGAGVDCISMETSKTTISIDNFPSSSYSGTLIGHNISTWSTGSGASQGTQAEATQPSWALDLGGRRGGDGAPWQTDMFTIMRRAAGGNWTRLTSINAVGNILQPDGSAASPAYSFASDPDTGIYRISSNLLGVAVAGVAAFNFGIASSLGGTYIQVMDRANGAGAVSGGLLQIGRNTSGLGAPGCLILVDKNGVPRYLWIDTAGKLRVGFDAPTENGSISDTSGTVVGTQV